MSWGLITVLYEDKRVSPKEFGPHAFLLACIAAEVDQSRFDLRRQITASPKGSDGKLKRALERDLDRLLSSGPVFAVFDDDQVRRCYGLQGNACKSELLARIKEGKEVEVILLDRNIEDLIVACCRVLDLSPPLGKPKPEERDRILQRAASARSEDLDAIRRAVPTFDRLVVKVIELLK